MNLLKSVILPLILSVASLNAIDYGSDKQTYTSSEFSTTISGWRSDSANFCADIAWIFPPAGMPDFYYCKGTHLYSQPQFTQGQAFGGGFLSPKYGNTNAYYLYQTYNNNIPTVINVYRGSKWLATAYMIVSDRYTPIRNYNWSDMWKNLIIVADGIDLEKDGARHVDDLICSTEYSNLLKKTDNTPLAMGYNIMFVDFVEGAGDITENAKVYAKLIELAHQNSGTNKIAVSGFSMGGVVARLALLYLEKSHSGDQFMAKINKYIAIDSPLQGASLCNDYQVALSELQDRALLKTEVKASLDKLRLPGCQQLLYHNVTTGAADEHGKFYSFLKSMGDYPIQTKKYAISEGKWEYPYGAQSSIFAGRIDYMNYSKYIYLKDEELMPGSYSGEDFQSQKFGLTIGSGPADLFIPLLKMYNYGNYLPTHIPVRSAFDLKSIDMTSTCPVTQTDLDGAARRHSTFDKILISDPTTRRRHITFNQPLIDKLMWVLADNDTITQQTDFISYSAADNGSVSVLSSTGKGFASKGKWITGFGAPDFATTGDFNGDGKADILWYHSWLKKGAVLTSNGNGYDWNGYWINNLDTPTFATAGDFNGDGKDDILWYSASTQKGEVLLSTGSGFASASYWFYGFGAPQFATAGDFNGDGKDDILWYHSWNQQAVVMLSNGKTFEWGGSWLTGFGTPQFATAGDFNGDGITDILWYHDWNQQAVVMLSNGNGFDWGGSWLTGFGMPQRAVAGDFNGDGKTDILWYHSWNQKAAVMLSTGSGFNWGGYWLENLAQPDLVFSGKIN